MSLKKRINDFFEFYPSEKKGVFFLAGLMAFWVLGLYIYQRMPANATHGDPEFEAAVLEYYQGLDAQAAQSSAEAPSNRASVQLFLFDPNVLSFDSLKLLGLPERTARAIVNYRASGGTFRNPDDLAKIYVLSEEDFMRLKPYVEISLADRTATTLPDREKVVTEAAKEKGAGEERQSAMYDMPELVELNLADTSDLVAIRGIGPFFARKIIERRDALGGFRDYTQLKEIYRFDDEKLEMVAPYLSLDTSLVHRIDLNKADIDRLKRHPYITFKIANSIVQMRNAHGSFRRVEDIQRSYLINDSIFGRIKPYLIVHE
ncbi:MAG: helix-hairpin-helix domain-containing protein [Cryomorphaceae bacterium]|nr:MAG: helix-hairpin-helix domain-containing protein [Cryomorphaceae bacterium]